METSQSMFILFSDSLSFPSFSNVSKCSFHLAATIVLSVSKSPSRSLHMTGDGADLLRAHRFPAISLGVLKVFKRLTDVPVQFRLSFMTGFQILLEGPGISHRFHSNYRLLNLI